MSRAGVIFLAGAAALLLVGLAVKYARRSEPEQLAAARQSSLTAAGTNAGRAGTERSGWIGRSNAGAGGGTGSGLEGRPPAGQGSSDIGGKSTAGSGPRGAADPGYRSSGGSGTRTGYAGSDAIHAEANISPAAPGEGVGQELSQRLRGAGQGGQPSNGPPQQEAATGLTEKSTTEKPTEEGQVLDLFNKGQTDKSENPPLSNEAVTIDEQGAHFQMDAQYEIPNAGNLNGEAGAVAFCLQNEWQGGDDTNASLVQLRNKALYENRLQVFKNGRYLRFILAPNTGMESGAGIPIDSWQPGQQHHIAAVWGRNPDTGDNMAALYVDGRLVGQETYDGSFEVSPGTPLLIGSDYAGGATSAGGTMSSFQGFSQYLPADRISNLAAGCIPP